ncbi:hypothetical protein AbraIFM66951_005605 [Aspergillus brasiliensis]|nr:hypothetical protein AbraIFM66951_005605 [Aspergillus brasiliensis]
MRTFFSGGQGQLPDGKSIQLPSRDPGRMIECRVVDPNDDVSSSSSSPKGIFLHLHGGGLVAGRHDSDWRSSIDASLLRYANSSKCKVVSVGYRLAPESPYPSGVQDCFDVADHFVESGPPLRVIGGESAGAFLAIQTIFHLLGTYPQLNTVKALILAYGCYSWSFLPRAYNILDSVCLNPNKLHTFRDLALTTHPALTATLRNFDAEFGALQTADHEIYNLSSSSSAVKHPVFSPLYRRFEAVGERLPPALFVVGTADPLADDTILMSAHWQLAQGLAVTRFVPGAPHAFAEMPIEAGDCCGMYHELVKEFLDEVIRQ